MKITKVIKDGEFKKLWRGDVRLICIENDLYFISSYVKDTIELDQEIDLKTGKIIQRDKPKYLQLEETACFWVDENGEPISFMEICLIKPETNFQIEERKEDIKLSGPDHDEILEILREMKKGELLEKLNEIILSKFEEIFDVFKFPELEKALDIKKLTWKELTELGKKLRRTSEVIMKIKEEELLKSEGGDKNEGDQENKERT
ncbi:MAG: hypothetical protein ACTSRP_01835 [Candidatus Helarchaeota archaeon]